MNITGDLWMRAAAFAARAHRDQMRKDGATPYYGHVARVAIVVSAMFKVDDEIALAIALLHDTIEDTTVDYDDLAEAFGHEVARGAALLTKDMRLPEDERERAYDEGLKGADWRVHLVKLADQYDNLADTLMSRAAEKKVRKRIEGCRRAIAVAAASSGRDDIARAIEIVRDLATKAERAISG